jgi:hypothetical protein
LLPAVIAECGRKEPEMAIEAPMSKFKKTNLKIYIVVCIALAVWCAYDGYVNKEWIEEHTNPDGSPMPYLIFNQKAPFFFGGAAVLLGVYLLVIKNKKLVADDNDFVIGPDKKIAYDSIQKIDKTNFDSKGYFIVTYKDKDGRENNRKISDRTYDNLKAVLEHLVAKIT